MRDNAFCDKVFNFTEENALFFLPTTVIVGVSGGADSMALLHALHSRCDDGLTVHAVHVHHGLRGEEADRDERVVRAFCDEHTIPLTVEHADVRALAARDGCGLEEAGRRVRYAIFERVRAAVGASCVATAHTADDVVETVLMHILRGCGGGGLVGIPVKRGCVVRPLLSCTRAEIETYCAAEHIPYITDSSNADTAFTRNRVRHEVLPLLRQLNPAVDGALLRLCSAAGQDEAFIAAFAAMALDEACGEDGSVACDVLLRQPPAVRSRLWKTILANDGCFSFTERHIAALERAAHSGGTVCLPQGHRVTVSCGRIKATPPSAEPFCIAADTLPLTFLLNGDEHTLRVVSREEWTVLQNVHKMFFKYSIDYDRIQGSLTVRGRREGDYVRLSQRKVGKSLKKLLSELRVPTYRRECFPFLCDDGGVVLVAGVDCDLRVRPDADTKHFLVWTVNSEPCYMR